MGATFGNLAIRTTDVDAVTAQLDADAGKARLARVPAGEPADRTVVLVPSGAWCMVYDEAADQQDEAAVDRVGQAMTRALGVPAFSVLVHDSDVLRVALFAAGKRVDRYDSNPGYFTGRGRRGPPEPHVAAWRRVLPDVDPGLSRVFGADDLFAEAALPVLEAAVGIDGGRLGVGLRYLQESPLPPGAVVLAYRSTSRPAWETPLTGPPRLESQWEQAARIHGHVRPHTAVTPTDASVGAELRISATGLNGGGPCVGLRVEIHGGADVAWQQAQLVLGDPRQGVWSTAPFVARDGAFVAEFPAAAVPAGRAFGAVTDPTHALKQLDARLATQVHVNVVGVGSRVAEADVEVRLVPSIGSGTAAVHRLRVVGTDDRPLRAPATVHPSQLAALRGDDWCVALVVLDPSDAVPGVGALADAIAPFVPRDGTVMTTTYPRTSGGLLGALMGVMKAPKTASGKALGFLAGARWRKHLAQLPDGANHLDAAWGPSDEAAEPVARIEAGHGMIPSSAPAFTASVAIRSPDRAVDAALVAAIDALAARGTLVQGVVTRWAQPASCEHTPYEQACGIQGQCTLDAAWAHRWLRAVGPGTVWVGPALRQHLADDTARIEVSDVRAAEERLAAVLPSAADWQDGLKRRYGR